MENARTRTRDTGVRPDSGRAPPGRSPRVPRERRTTGRTPKPIHHVHRLAIETNYKGFRGKAKGPRPTGALSIGKTPDRNMERATGFEPATSSLGSLHSTPELRPLTPCSYHRTDSRGNRHAHPRNFRTRSWTSR